MMPPQATNINEGCYFFRKEKKNAISDVLDSLFVLPPFNSSSHLFVSYTTLGGRMTTPQSRVSFVSCYTQCWDLNSEA